MADQALACRAPGLLGRGGKATLAENGIRVLEVAVGFGERGLAFHHSCAGLVAELLDVCCRNRHVEWAIGRSRDLVTERSGEIADSPDRQITQSRFLGRSGSGFARAPRRSRGLAPDVVVAGATGTAGAAPAVCA